MSRIKPRYLAISLGICFFTAFIGSFFTAGSVKEWYPTLVKPSFNPPNWLFGPIWSTLYVAMGIACALVLSTKTKKSEKKEGTKLFFAQLVFNMFWSVLFFGLRMPALAFGGIISLWLLIFFTITRFYSLNKLAAALMIPYILWVSYATILNYYIVILN